MAAFANGTPIALDMDHEISPQLQLAETVILGLRLCEGVNLDNMRSRFGIDIRAWYRQQIGACVDYGLLEHADGHIKLTRRGRLLSNEVFWRFLPG
jgi:oxygen-independent coproporphyrinogen-3 oxidase